MPIIHLLVIVIVVALICGVLAWFIDQAPFISPPYKQFAKFALAAIFVIVLIVILLAILGVMSPGVLRL